MRRPFVIVCLTAIIIVFSTMLRPHSAPPVSAQSPDSEWRDALNADIDQLVAYTLDGEVNVLLENEDTRLRFGIMFTENNALVALENDEVSNFYHLTPESAEPVEIDLAFDWLPIVQTDRYAVLRGGVNLRQGFPGILYDSQTQQVHELQGYLVWPVAARCCRFSADGQTLRYLSYTAEDIDEWQIIERNLDTGEERQFFAPDVQLNDSSTLDTVTSDRHGERWYWRHLDEATEQVSFNRVDGDGSNALIQTYNTQDIPDTFYNVSGGFLIQFSASCEVDCRLTVHLPEGDVVMLQSDNLFPSDLIQLSETQFLAEDRGSDYWLISTDAAPQLIGVFSPIRIYSRQIISPDTRWLTVIDNDDEPQAWYVWDSVSQATVFAVAILEDVDFTIYNIFYSPVGQIIYAVYQRDETFVGFEYASGEAVSLPVVENEGRLYFELLSDGMALLRRYDRDTRTQLGIWQYDVTTDEMSQILPDGFWEPLIFRDLR